MNYYPELFWIIINFIQYCLFIKYIVWQLWIIQNVSCELLSFISSCGFLHERWGPCLRGLMTCVVTAAAPVWHSVSPPGFGAAVVRRCHCEPCTSGLHRWVPLLCTQGFLQGRMAVQPPGRYNSEGWKHGVADATGSLSPPMVRKSAGKFISLLSFWWDNSSELCYVCVFEGLQRDWVLYSSAC